MLTGSLWGPQVSFLRFLCQFRRSSDQFCVNFRATITSPRPCLLDSFLKYIFCRNRDPTTAGRQTFKGRRLNTSQIYTERHKKKRQRASKPKKQGFVGYIFRTGHTFGQVWGPVWHPSGNYYRLWIAILMTFPRRILSIRLDGEFDFATLRNKEGLTSTWQRG